MDLSLDDNNPKLDTNGMSVSLPGGEASIPLPVLNPGDRTGRQVHDVSDLTLRKSPFLPNGDELFQNVQLARLFIAALEIR